MNLVTNLILCNLQEIFLSSGMIFPLLYYAKVSIQQVIVQIVFNLDSIFALSATFFYFTLSTLAIELLRQMRIEIEHVNDSTRFLLPAVYVTKWEFYLKKWRHRYLTLSQLVDCINQCFGPILFYSTVYFFCTIINDVFFSIIFFQAGVMPYLPIFLCKIFKICAYMVGVTAVASKMKNEASYKIQYCKGQIIRFVI